MFNLRSSPWRCSLEKVFSEILQKLQENTCALASFLIKLQALAWNFFIKEALMQVFSCEFCEISKNIFLTEHLWTTASVTSMFKYEREIYHVILVKLRLII